MAAPLTSLFRPSRIAMIGASSNPAKIGFQIFRNIRDAGFAGEIVPVNPKGKQSSGFPPSNPPRISRRAPTSRSS